MAIPGTRTFNEFANQLSFYNTDDMGPSADGSDATQGGNASTPEETQRLVGMAYSGLAMAKTGFDSVKNQTKSAVSAAQASVSEAVVTPTRLALFTILAAVGGLFLVLAFFLLPLVVFAPQKFALMFTLGSFSLLSSIAALKGTGAFVRHFFSCERLPFSFTYFASLFLTLYATLFARSYLLTLIFAAVQITALASCLITYLPGGIRALGYTKGLIWDATKRLFSRGESSTLLPF